MNPTDRGPDALARLCPHQATARAQSPSSIGCGTEDRAVAQHEADMPHRVEMLAGSRPREFIDSVGSCRPAR